MKRINVNDSREKKSREIASAMGYRLNIQNVINNLKYWLNLDGINLNTEKCSLTYSLLKITHRTSWKRLRLV